MHDTEKTTIVFTDSGLGAISIMAGFYNMLQEAIKDLPGGTIEIIFFNALKEFGHGYNTMATQEEKVSTFNAALEMISEFYNPTFIAIACNTLSSIYPQTAFVKSAHNTFEIISGGRTQISDFRKHHPKIPVVVLATKTTIDAGAYNFDDPKIIPVSGGFLAQHIEFDNTSVKIIKTLHVIFKEIESLLAGQNEIALFLGCTHYGYISDLLYKTVEDFKFSISEILNPNTAFAQLLFNTVKNLPANGRKSNINVRIESQAFIDPSEIISICNLVKKQSPEITKILQNYTRLEKRF